MRSDVHAFIIYFSILSLLVISGTSLFPFIFRNIIIFVKFISPWKHKIVFDYILLNNHRLSTVLFPTVQTRIYITMTILLYILGFTVSLMLDYSNQSFASYTPGKRLLIFLFQTVNSRFAGFQTVDVSLFAEATLIVYLLLMAVKPQMLCALDESPFELEWISLQTQDEVEKTVQQSVAPTTTNRRRLSSTSSCGSSMIFPIQHMHKLIRKKSLKAKLRARKYFSKIEKVENNKPKTPPVNVSLLRIQLFLLVFSRKMLSHTFSFLILTRTWLFIFIFLICAFESHHTVPIDENITVFKIIFEVISAFGAVGLTTGYPNIKSSFATVLSIPSKIILVITMLMGRHRGLLNSMKDQEQIEYSAQVLLDIYRKQ
ncbi:unnamed protein product, partial [Didymodactylos carnosus]